MQPDVEKFFREDLPRAWSEPVLAMERHFGIRFGTVFRFSAELLADLHHPDGPEWEADTQIVSRSSPGILADVGELGRIANLPSLANADRVRYRDALLRVYRQFPFSGAELAADAEAYVVAPEREGRILAEALGWLPASRNLHPHAKRMGFRGGLLVGITAFLPPAPPVPYHCVMVDGAIASGSTLMAFMACLRDRVTAFDVYSVHAAEEGVRALVRFGRRLDRPVRVCVGHMTPGLNAKYYAVEPEHPDRVVVGDLGDTISPLETTGGG